MELYFGNSDKWTKISAPNMEVAKKIFMATELFPERYVEDKWIIKKTRKYNGDLNRYTFKTKPGALITIKDKGKGGYIGRKVGTISLQECLDFDFKDIQSTATKFLSSPDVEGPKKEETTLPVVGTATELQLNSKTQLREKHDLIKYKMAELEVARRELVEAKNALEKEISAKRRVIFIIETFLGVAEEVILLKEGQKASEKEPMSIYQEKLYMDEEIGIWSDGGLDYNSIEKFDDWITEHYKIFLYKPKSICAFQIRRKEKKYSSNPLENAFMNQDNFRTYFLIRNGDSLYRIWSNIHIPEKLFPRADEMEQVYSSLKDYEKEDLEEVKEKMEKWQDTYLFSLLAIQGMIERTDIFGTSLKGVVNLSKSDGVPEDRVEFIRDAEKEHYISDGRPSWHDYLKENSKKVGKGTRVLLDYSCGYSYNDENRWRNDPFNASFPEQMKVYTVEESIEEKADRSTYHTWSHRIMYSPNDTIYSRWDYHERKRRVPFRLYSDEVINFDAISLEDIEYYLSSRLHRQDYCHMLRYMFYIKKLKKEERALEAQLVKYLAGELGWGENRYEDIHDAVTWWKLKNKWKRAVTKDEAKAVRMVLKRLRKEDAGKNP